MGAPRLDFETWALVSLSPLFAGSNFVSPLFAGSKYFSFLGAPRLDFEMWAVALPGAPFRGPVNRFSFTCGLGAPHLDFETWETH